MAKSLAAASRSGDRGKVGLGGGGARIFGLACYLTARWVWSARSACNWWQHDWVGGVLRELGVEMVWIDGLPATVSGR